MNTQDKKKTVPAYIKVFLLIAIIVITYFLAWFELYRQSNNYFEQAMKSYNDKNFVVALKGESKLSLEGEGSYTFTAGFEQVVDEFSSPYAFPKPKVYYDALKMIDDIINTKITPNAGYEIYQKYYGIDNGNLGRVLLRVGDIYYGDKNYAEAYKAYALAESSFPFNADISKAAKDGMNKTNTQSVIK